MLKVTAAVIEKDGRMLIARRRRSDRMGGKWEFPGGKMGFGETPEECLRRELREELGIEARIGSFICRCKFSYMRVPLELLVYRATHVSGDVTPNEHDEVRWVKASELGLYDMVKADTEVVRRLLEGRPDGDA
jgi:8-oxo-dGTP diphosphatase